MLLPAAQRRDLGSLVRAAMVMVLAGALYRFDTYLVAFTPGRALALLPERAGDVRSPSAWSPSRSLAYIVDRQDVPDPVRT